MSGRAPPVAPAQAGAFRSRAKRAAPGDASLCWHDAWGFALPLLLAACSPAAETPGAASPSEEQALNDAAAALDANAIDTNAAEIVDDANQGQTQ